MLHRMTCCDERSVMRCSPLSQPVALLSNYEGLEKYKNVPNISFRPRGYDGAGLRLLLFTAVSLYKILVGCRQFSLGFRIQSQLVLYLD